MEDFNADFTRRAVVATARAPWEPSPSRGVLRKRLERLGGESGRATSLVRFAPGAGFPEHAHPEGEEVFVLDGVFCDETGDYPAASALFNPPGTRHAPYAPDGCTLFVKLRQFGGAGRARVAVHADALAWEPGEPDGIARKWLYRQAGFPETVALERWQPGAGPGRCTYPLGAEMFVLEGAFTDEADAYDAGTWLRLPPGAAHTPRAREGCTLYIKRASLAAARAGAPAATHEGGAR